jgi:hypothetical protein
MGQMSGIQTVDIASPGIIVDRFLPWPSSTAALEKPESALLMR